MNNNNRVGRRRHQGGIDTSSAAVSFTRRKVNIGKSFCLFRYYTKKSPFKKLPIIDVVRQTRKGECSLPFEKIKVERTGNPKVDYERDFVVRKIRTGRRNPIKRPGSIRKVLDLKWG